MLWARGGICLITRHFRLETPFAFAFEIYVDEERIQELQEPPSGHLVWARGPALSFSERSCQPRIHEGVFPRSSRLFPPPLSCKNDDIFLPHFCVTREWELSQMSCGECLPGYKRGKEYYLTRITFKSESEGNQLPPSSIDLYRRSYEPFVWAANFRPLLTRGLASRIAGAVHRSLQGTWRQASSSRRACSGVRHILFLGPSARAF